MLKCGLLEAACLSSSKWVNYYTPPDGADRNIAAIYVAYHLSTWAQLVCRVTRGLLTYTAHKTRCLAVCVDKVTCLDVINYFSIVRDTHTHTHSHIHERASMGDVFFFFVANCTYCGAYVINPQLSTRHRLIYMWLNIEMDANISRYSCTHIEVQDLLV